jgi:hypothetical protein
VTDALLFTGGQETPFAGLPDLKEAISLTSEPGKSDCQLTKRNASAEANQRAAQVAEGIPGETRVHFWVCISSTAPSWASLRFKRDAPSMIDLGLQVIQNKRLNANSIPQPDNFPGISIWRTECLMVGI